MAADDPTEGREVGSLADWRALISSPGTSKGEETMCKWLNWLLAMFLSLVPPKDPLLKFATAARLVKLKNALPSCVQPLPSSNRREKAPSPNGDRR